MLAYTRPEAQDAITDPPLISAASGAIRVVLSPTPLTSASASPSPRTVPLTVLNNPALPAASTMVRLEITRLLPSKVAA